MKWNTCKVAQKRPEGWMRMDLQWLRHSATKCLHIKMRRYVGISRNHMEVDNPLMCTGLITRVLGRWELSQVTRDLLRRENVPKSGSCSLGAVSICNIWGILVIFLIHHLFLWILQLKSLSGPTEWVSYVCWSTAIDTEYKRLLNETCQADLMQCLRGGFQARR